MLGMSAVVSNTSSSPPAPYQPLVIVLTATAAGILLDRFSPLPLRIWGALAVGSVVCWPLAWRRGRLLLGSLALCMAIAATAAAWHHCRWYLLASDDLGRYARVKAQPACIEAVAVRMPRRLPTPEFDPLQMFAPTEQSRLEVDVVGVRDGASWRSASGRATIEVRGPSPEVHAGDRLRCFVRLSAPAPPHNPGARDYAAQLRAEGVHTRLLAEVSQCISVIRPGAWLGFSALLDQVRAHSDRLLETYLDSQSAEMAEAVLLGQREEMESCADRKLHGHRHDSSVGHSRLASGNFGRGLLLDRATNALAARLGAGAGGRGGTAVHVPGRCPAADAAGDGVGARRVCGRLFGPPPAVVQFAGRRGAGRAGRQSQRSVSRRRSFRFSRWPA